MKKPISLLAIIALILLLDLPAHAQEAAATPALPTTIEGWADRLNRFGQAIPQEKVFVHLDNTCYFLGDTIWYKAYTRRTDKDVPSNVSRVLYAELYNQDGYLVERQMVKMRHGEGHGNFVLTDTLYGGYYELRAYTRWQLNWGQTQHPHTRYAERWFFNQAMAREYYRDYEKLYSRVFPVYDKPKQAGEYAHDMTVRPLRRVYKEEDKSAVTLSCYPEGGQLVAGAPCRMAFEATTEEGEWMEGECRLLAADGTTVAQAQAVSRGRGSLCFTPQATQTYTVSFTATDGRTASLKLDAAATDGVALSMQCDDDTWHLSITPCGTTATKPLGFTIMNEGVVHLFQEIDHAPFTLDLPCSDLKVGVNQVTVFDADGRVWADRLFFVTTPDLLSPSLTIEGLKEQYEPYEEVALTIYAATESSASLSVAVRDAALQDYLYDSGNIMTEMLLSSEIRGFVPQPAYFFESDDEPHRTALDLLMLTQGWRRFNWHTMATPGAFALNHPAEYTQVLSGIVHNYQAHEKEDLFEKLATEFEESRNDDEDNPWDDEEEADEKSASEKAYTEMLEGMKSYQAHETWESTDGLASTRFMADEGRLKHEVLVHADFSQPGSEQAILGDAVTERGRFKMQVPDFEGYCVLLLGASDTTKWKGRGHEWLSMNEGDYPEFYVRLSFPYPRFVKPYNFYQTRYRPTPEGRQQSLDFIPDDGTLMNTVTVKSRRRGLRRLDSSKPAFVLDAIEAFNEAVDAGLSVAWYQGHTSYIQNIARTYIGDMNIERNYPIEVRYNSRNKSFYHSTSAINDYNFLYNIDKVYVYTDYSPRREGSSSFSQDNQPIVTIDLRRPADSGMRVTYRDRFYALQGFNVADDFYAPDYSRHPLPEGQTDYRRTLYWNPDVPLDADGSASIIFYNGSKSATLDVEAQGQTNDGALLNN